MPTDDRACSSTARCDNRVGVKIDAIAVVAICGGFFVWKMRKNASHEKNGTRIGLKTGTAISHMSMIAEIASNEANHYKNYLRITEDCFEDILGLFSNVFYMYPTLGNMLVVLNPHIRAVMFVLGLGLLDSIHGQ